MEEKILDKTKFYEQLKNFNNKSIPIFIKMSINENSEIKIVLHEHRITSDKNVDYDFDLQIINSKEIGYQKYICNDIKFNLLAENIKSDYQLYKFINKKLNEVLKEHK